LFNKATQWRRSWQKEREGDLFKMSKALEQGMSFVRMLSSTVAKGKPQSWQAPLAQIISEGVRSTTPQIWFQESPHYHEMAASMAAHPSLRKYPVLFYTVGD